MKNGENKTHQEKVEDDLKIYLRSEEFWSCNAFGLTAGTNTPCGGDASHGGKTFFKLKDLAGTYWDIYINGKEVAESPSELTIMLYGDSEAETFADSLIFAGRTLKKQIRENHWRDLCSKVFALEQELKHQKAGCEE